MFMAFSIFIQVYMLAASRIMIQSRAVTAGARVKH